MLDTDLAWAAGFFEGEGCVSYSGSVQKGRKYSYLRMQAYQADPVPLEKFKTLFGGTVKERTREGALGNKPLWTWSLSGKQAEIAFGLIRQYFSGQDKVKKFEVTKKRIQKEREGWSAERPTEIEKE